MTGSEPMLEGLLASRVRDSDVLVGTAGLFSNPPHLPKSEDLEAERQRAVEGSLKDKLDYIRSRAIMTPAFKQALEQVSYMVLKAGADLSPGGLVVTGEGGCGKSFLAQQVSRRFPEQDNLYQRNVPVALVELSGTPDEKDVLRELLGQLGENVEKSRFSAAELESKIVIACEQVQCRCLIFDEAQRLGTFSGSRREKDRLMGPVGERIKRIHNRAKVGIVLLGTPMIADLVDSDAQYRTRWSGRVALKPITRSETFLTVLGSYERMLPTPMRSELATQKIGYAIWDACGGYFRSLVQILCDAVVLAVKNEAAAITLEHLEEAYYLTNNAESSNPFSALRGGRARG